MVQDAFPERKKGHRLTADEWNDHCRELRKLRDIKGLNGILVSGNSGGMVIDGSGISSLAMTLCKCTSVDDPEDGLHTFEEIGLDGLFIEGGKQFTNCRLLGDWTQGTWLPATDDAPYYDGTEAMVFTYKGTNVAWVIGSFWMD